MTRLRTFAAGTLISALCALIVAPVAARAAESQQVIAGSRVAAVADKVAHGLIAGPDRSIAAAYQVADQLLPTGAVQLAPAGAPFVSATYVGVPVAIRVDGKLARTVVAG